MIVPDVNLLLYAYDRSFPEHAKAKDWWEAALNGDEPVGIPWVVILGFVRLTTHPTVCQNPRTPAECRLVVDAWLSQPNVRLLQPSPSCFNRFFDLLEEARSGGNLTTDALIAATAIEAGGRVYSNDRDFDRFKELVWTNPVAT